MKKNKKNNSFLLPDKEPIVNFCQSCKQRPDYKQLYDYEADKAIAYLKSPFADDDLSYDLIYLLTKGRKNLDWSLSTYQIEEILNLIDDPAKQFANAIWIEAVFMYLYGNYEPLDEEKTDLWYKLLICATDYKLSYFSSTAFDLALRKILEIINFSEENPKWYDKEIINSYLRQIKQIYDYSQQYLLIEDYFMKEKILSGVQKVLEFMLDCPSREAFDLANKLVWQTITDSELQVLNTQFQEKYND